ncbi:MAG: PAS domain S-box protein, partial [Bacteroidia bacterium]|nr:PAS domain S-box protein [Bacteroidia bacterium]
LLTSEERLRIGLNTANIAVFNQDKDLRYVWMYQPQLGYNSEEVVGHTDADLLPPEASKQVTKIKKHVLESGLKEEAEVPISIGGKDFIYYLVVEPFRDENNSIIGITGASLDITERKLTEERLKKSLKEIRELSSHLQIIREEERTRIAREIHDELGQELTIMKMDVSWLNEKLKKSDKDTRQKTEGLMRLLDQTVNTVRRIASELRPGLLDDMGLAAALEWQLSEFEKRSGVKTEFKEMYPDLALPDTIKTGLFRIVQESLTNVGRYAKAKKVIVTLDYTGHQVELIIKDDGIGFEKEKIATKRTLGLLGMKERTEMMGGAYEINSTPGKGTIVTIIVPFEK